MTPDDHARLADLMEREAPVRARSGTGASWTGRVIGYCDGPSVTLDTSRGHITLALDTVTITETAYDAAMYVDRKVLHAGLAAVLEARAGEPPGDLADATVAWLRERLAP